MSLIDDASLIQIPSGYKEDKLYSLKPTNGDGDFTFTRASSATRVNADGLIEEVPYNLLQQSNDFDTTWDLSAGIDLTSGQSGYNGSNDAWLLKKNTTGARSVKQDLTRPSGQYSFSVYLKAESTDWIYIWAYDGSTAVNAYFDLNNGVVGNTSGLDSTNVVSVGDDWYRCTITFTQAITRVRIYPAYANGSLETGTDNGIYIQDAQLNSGSTAKPYFPTTDRLNVPRLDYSGGASCASLLLEPQRSNLVTYSESFDNAFWDKIRGNITSNALISPDGTLSADLFTSIDNATAYVQNNASITVSGSKQSISLFVKKGNTNWCYLLLWDGTANGCYQYFDIENGVSGDEDTFGSGVTVDTTNIENYPNDWYRISVTYNCSITNLKARISQTNGNSDVLSNTGATIYIWGFQVESNSSYPTSYIPSNSGSQTTRTADACNGAGTSATFNDSEGVLMAEISAVNDSTTKLISIANTSGSENTVWIGYENGVYVVVRSNNVTVISTSVIPIQSNDITKCALLYSNSSVKLYINGFNLFEDSNIVMPIGLDQLRFSRQNGSLPFYGKTKQIQYYDSALTDAQLEEITSWTSFNEMATALNYTII